MSDSIKFGPEWLRNMSNDTGSLSATSGGGGGGGGLYSNSRMYCTIHLFRLSSAPLACIENATPIDFVELFPFQCAFFLFRLMCRNTIPVS